MAMDHELSILSGTAELLEIRQQELARAREEIVNAEQMLDKQAADLRMSTADNRKEVINRNNKEEELRRKIRELEKLLEEKEIDSMNDRKKWNNETDRDKKQLENIIVNLEKDNNTLQNELDFQREQMSGEIDALNNECLNL